MKTKLTEEESAHLIELGVPKEKATIFRIACDVRVTGYRDEYLFTLQNLLEILPKEIFDEDLYSRNYLVVECTNTGLWHVGYAHEISYEGYFFLIERFAEELIDSLYELCVWCIKNYYLNPKEL